MLRRTKLGESDVIVTLLAQDGSQVRAVAKGARKPTSSFSSRLELFCVCDLLLVSGKSLDIVKEARLVESNDHLRGDLELMEAASPVVEILDRTTQVGLEDGRLFDMACAALRSLRDSVDPDVLTAAHLLKTLAVLGFRPRFDLCVGCGTAVDLGSAGRYLAFSLVDGGLVCPACRSQHETVLLPHDVVSWSQALLFATFAEVGTFRIPPAVVLDVLRFLQMWVRQHLGVKLKSLDYLIVMSA